MGESMLVISRSDVRRAVKMPDAIQAAREAFVALSTSNPSAMRCRISCSARIYERAKALGLRTEVTL
jgi:hypothetical protein